MANQNIVIIDYGMGNIGSIRNMLQYLGEKVRVSSDPEVIKQANKLILPGVGHFDRAMENIEKFSLREVISEMALVRKVPFLGICLGMQLMCNSSEEGTLPGLSLVNAQVRKYVFPEEIRLKVPHMSWNYIQQCKESNLLTGLDEKSRFYFVHSYFVDCELESDILTRTTYGHPFVSAFESGNLVGVQFHPEKSHKYGISLFKNFLTSF
jgi:imidazole glycerol-phosphate synthase subunit HisH